MDSRPGIKACGVYLPRLRLERTAIAAATGWASGARAGKRRGSRSCCNWDEDSVTMAVEAARDSVAREDRARIGWLALASTTLPFADRSNAGVVATALDLPESVAAIDVAGSQRAATGALLQALERPGVARGDALVVAADRRLAKPGSEQEMDYGHGAAAIVVGCGADVIAEMLGRSTLLADFVDHYRRSGAEFDYALEERWVRDEGYLKVVPRAVTGALEAAGVLAADVRHFVAAGPKRFAAAAARAVGIPADAVADDLHSACGDTGTAHVLLLLAGALETAKAGEIIVVAGFGQGCDAIVLGVTDRIGAHAAHGGLRRALERGATDREYLRFLSNCGLVDMDWGMRSERDNRTAQSAAWRRHRDVTAFIGGRCAKCGTVQYPKSQACVNPDCRAYHAQEDYALADTTGRVKTFTEDWLAFTRCPPLVYGNVAFEAGGNVFIEFTDTAAGELAVGTPVRFAFRVKDIDRVRGFHRYFWKATPVRN
jgi:3-hydroxy-3-methylglutaryl CoA synthase